MSQAFDLTVPVLIVGGGACGCVAALAVRDAGVQPLVIEQDARPTGSTGMSQGLICAAGTRAQAEAGVDDDGETFFADIIAKTRGQTDPVIARAIAHGSGPTLDWLVEHHQLPWTLDTAFRAAYGNSRLRVHGWAGHGGGDMIELLHARLDEAGIDVLTSARLTAIVPDAGGGVAGVEITRPDGVVERIGCDALILACGGFAANPAMIAEYMPEAVNARYHGHDGNRGDGMALTAVLGAALGDMGSYQGYAMLTEPQAITVPPGVLVEGGVIVNMHGNRFVDETADIAGMVHDVMAQPDGICWVVFDAGIEQRCGHIPEIQALIALNAARKGDTIAELAGRIGVPGGALAQTLDAAHAAQAAGLPDGFGRPWGSDVPPVPAYRALKVVGAIYHTQGGLQIDGSARVLRTDGTRFPNLFAGGGAARGVSGPSSWGYLPAMGLCAAVTLGRIAGVAAAALVSANTR